MNNRPPFHAGELIAVGTSMPEYGNTYGVILNDGELVKEPYYQGGFAGDGYWYFDVLAYDGTVLRVREELIFDYSSAKEAFQESLQSDFGEIARRQHEQSRHIVIAHKAISTAARYLNAEVPA